MDELNFTHTPVMLNECIEGLTIKENGTYADCTTGGGGHSIEIAKRLGENGRLICIDEDMTAIEAAKIKLAAFTRIITFAHDNFSNIAGILDNLSIDKIDGALLDLGVSSYQLDTPSRGFSYNSDAPLDMRMNTDSPLTAYDVINTYDEAKLREIIFGYGEENSAPRIAKAIVSARDKAPVKTTLELSDIIKSAVPKKELLVGHHPAKKTFQAIRIEVNRELDIIEPTLRAIVSRLNSGGRIAVITFHSLEDRLAKQTFTSLAQGCTCPPDFPVCVCGKKPQIKLISKKPILPSEDELRYNRRSHSAKLRIAEKI